MIDNKTRKRIKILWRSIEKFGESLAKARAENEVLRKALRLACEHSASCPEWFSGCPDFTECADCREAYFLHKAREPE